MTGEFCSEVPSDPSLTDNYGRHPITIDGQRIALERIDAQLPQDLDLSGANREGLQELVPRSSEGALIAYDIISRTSFDRVKDFVAWIRSVDRSKGYRLGGIGYPISLIGVDTGSSNARQVESVEGQRLFTELGLDGEFMEVRTRTGENVEKCFHDLMQKIRLTKEVPESVVPRPRRRIRLPATWRKWKICN
jgi:hypothetical protein